MQNTRSDAKKIIKEISSRLKIPDYIDNRWFIAGGMLTSIFSDKPINDIDISFYNEINYYTIRGVFDSNGFKKLREGQNAITYEMCNLASRNLLYEKQKVQLIKNKFYTPEDTIKRFDFTICSACYIPSTDTILKHPLFEKHIEEKILMINDSGEPLSLSYRRIKKYEERGYKFVGDRNICSKCKNKFNCLTNNIEICKYGYPEI